MNSYNKLLDSEWQKIDWTDDTLVKKVWKFETASDQQIYKKKFFWVDLKILSISGRGLKYNIFKVDWFKERLTKKWYILLVTYVILEADQKLGKIIL